MISATAREAGDVDRDDRTGLLGRVTDIAGRWGAGDRPTVAGTFWFGAASLYLVALAVAMSTLSFDVWGGLVVAPVLTVLTVPLVQRIARADADPGLGKLLVAAFAVKLAGTLLRYAVTFEVYSSGADAVGYHGAGVRLAAAFWRGSFAETAEAELPELTGTPFIRLVTTVIYVVIGPTQLGGFLVFSWLSFWGMLWFYRAAVVAFPGANHRRYAVLLLFLPAMAYWPSSIGKEAWMIFTMGLASYGVALVLRHKPLGYTAATLGLVGTAMVRPHVTALIFMSLFVAYLLRRRSWRDAALGPIGKAVGVAVLLAGGGIVLSQATQFFDIDNVDRGSVEQVLDTTEQRTAQGGSAFDNEQVRSPAEFPQALVSVLFRPFLWEASNVPAVISAVESSLLLVLVASSLPRLLRLPVYLFRVPYVAYCASFVAMFVIAFSSVGNFGLLARQRTQVFPFLLVLLAIPLGEHVRRRPAGGSPRSSRP